MRATIEQVSAAFLDAARALREVARDTAEEREAGPCYQFVADAILALNGRAK